MQIDALQRARKADGVRTVHEKVQQRQQAAEAAIAAAALAAEEAILAAATEVDSPGPLGGSSSGVGSPRLGMSRSASNTGTLSSTPSRTLAAATSGLRLSSADITVTQAQATVAAAEPVSVSPTATATTTATTTAAVVTSATAAGTVSTPDTPLLSQTSQTSLSTTTTAASTVDRAKSMSALGGGTEVVHDAIPEEGALDSCQNSVKICTTSTGAAEKSDSICDTEIESAMVATTDTAAAVIVELTPPDITAAEVVVVEAAVLVGSSTEDISTATVDSQSTVGMSPRCASTPVLSSSGVRPGSSVTPHGGRKGQELARAIEHDAQFQQDHQQLTQEPQPHLQQEQNSTRLGSASSPNTPTHRENSFTVPVVTAPIIAIDTPGDANI